jgi:hypothetical protein
MTQLVDLADEFELTTVEAIELCAALGIPAEASDAELDEAQAETFRSAVPAWRAAKVEEQVAAAPGAMPLAPIVSQTDFTQVPTAWHDAARVPPPPAPGSQGTERAAVVALVAAVVSIVISAITGLCGVLVALVPIGLSVKAKKAIDANATSGKGLVLLARVGAVVSIVLALAVTWVAYTGNVHRLPTIALLDVFAPGDLRAAKSLEVGECILEPDSLPGATELRVVQVVPCSDEHDIEYFARLDTFGVTPVDDLPEFPGDDSLRSVMFAECQPLWEEFTGSTLGDSELDLAISYPQERAWETGDHLLLCGVASADGSSLEGTMAGAGR